MVPNATVVFPHPATRCKVQASWENILQPPSYNDSSLLATANDNFPELQTAIPVAQAVLYCGVAKDNIRPLGCSPLHSTASSFSDRTLRCLRSTSLGNVCQRARSWSG